MKAIGHAAGRELQIHRGMLRKQREHVVKKGYPSLDGGFPLSVDVQLEADVRFSGGALNDRPPWFHGRELSRRRH